MARIASGRPVKRIATTSAEGFLATSISPRVLFIAGALLFPAFLMQQDIVLRSLEVLIFVVLNALAGRHIRVMNYLVVMAGIVVFNLVIPTGRELVSLFGWSITEGALKSGLHKGTAMAGLIALSQFSIRSGLHLPGRLGGLIGRSLYYFEKIMSQRRRIDRKDVIGSIDALLLEIHAAGAEDRSRKAERSRSTVPGVAFLGALVAVAWAAWVLTLVHPRPFWG